MKDQHFYDSLTPRVLCARIVIFLPFLWCKPLGAQRRTMTIRKFPPKQMGTLDRRDSPAARRGEPALEDTSCDPSCFVLCGVALDGPIPGTREV